MSETNNLPIDYPEPSEDRDFLDQLIHEQEMLKHVYDLNAVSYTHLRAHET